MLTTRSTIVDVPGCQLSDVISTTCTPRRSVKHKLHLNAGLSAGPKLHLFHSLQWLFLVCTVATDINAAKNIQNIKKNQKSGFLPRLAPKFKCILESSHRRAPFDTDVGLGSLFLFIFPHFTV